MSEKELYLHELHTNDKGMEMKVSGEPAKLFMSLLIDLFEQNGGKNFLTITVHNQEKKYGITIQDCNGLLSPAEKMQSMSEEIESLKQELARMKGEVG